MVVFMITAIVILVVILAVLILVNVPQICVFGTCFTLIPAQLGSQITFWMLLVTWIVVQVVIIVFYYWLFTRIARSVDKARSYVRKFLDWSRNLFDKV